MSSPDTEMAQRFIAALHALERERDLDTIAGLFADDGEIGNIVSPRTFTGREGARHFWESYRGTFDEIESTFRTVIARDGQAALEWTTDGTSADGDPFTYSGVSILEFANGQITRFWAYFDPHALGRQLERGAQVQSVRQDGPELLRG